jgi:hypothetical protein
MVSLPDWHNVACLIAAPAWREVRASLAENLRVGIPQNILLHLAHGVARQIVDDEDALRHLELGKTPVERLQHEASLTLAPLLQTTTAVTPSPKSACGTPITADSITPGMASISLSISLG